MFKKQFNRTSAVVWRKFSRRGYAVFRSLGKVVSIGVLAASALTYASLGTSVGAMAMGLGYSGDPEDTGALTLTDDDDGPWDEDWLLDGDQLFCLTAVQADTLASAISEVTDGNVYHVAIVGRSPQGQVTVIEATTGRGVCERPLSEFLADSHHDPYGRPLVKVGRLKDRSQAEQHVDAARNYIGRPYDFQYLEGDSALYCSELIHYAYTASDGQPIFRQQPMSFHDADGNVTDFWKEWYSRWNMKVPEGAPGTNPVGLSRSPEIEIVGDIYSSPHKAVSLGVVEVTATRSPVSSEKINRIVQIVGKRQIAVSASPTVNDLLKLVSGVDVRQRGAFGVQTDMCVNGGTEDQVAVFLNGMNMTNPQTGHGSFDPPVNPDDIERIEVIDGGASRIYGSQAFSGAINIVTRVADRNSIGATVEGGSFRTFTANAYVTQASSKFRNRFSGGYSRSDGADSNDDFRRGNAFWHGRFLSGKWRVAAQAGYNTIDFGANTFYGTGSDSQYEELRRWLTSVEVSWSGSINVMGRAYWTRMRDHYVWKRDAPEAYQNFHRTDAYGGSLNAGKQWRFGTTSLGGEVRREQIRSTNLGNDGRTSVGIYLEHNVNISRVNISVGAFGHYNTADNSGLHIYPGVDISWQTTDRLRLFASINRSMRMPTFTDLHYNGPGLEGNARLKPEECNDFSIGTAFSTGSFSLNAKGFYRHGTNMIDWVKYVGADVFTTANSDIDVLGAQLSAALNFGQDRFVRNIAFSYCFLNKYRVHPQEAAQYESDLDYLRHKLVASLGHRIFSRLSAQWEAVLKDRRGWFDNAKTGRRQDYGTFATLDLKLQWTAPHYTLYVKATNLTNHRYYDYANVLQPGLWLLGGLKLHL